MAYKAIKKCANPVCDVNFICNSNKQIYCKPCAKDRRKTLRPEWNQKYNMKNAEQKNAESRAYNKSEKGRAAQKLRDAIRQGKITRQPCEICNLPDAQGHHEDYSKPLEVRWLCAQHHREEHLFEPWQNELRRAGYTGGFELSQLIEACGDRFVSLKADVLGDATLWYAIGRIDKYATRIQEAKSPIEAMAKLWLYLNKK